jgi:hypothetical protein
MPRQFHLDIKGLDELREAVKRFPRETKIELIKANKRIGATIVRNTVPLTPGPGLSKSTTGYKPSGALRRSIRYELDPRGGGWRGVKVKAGGPGVNYAFYVHEGLGRHRKWGPRPFLAHGAEASLPQIRKHIQKAVNNSLKIFNAPTSPSVLRRVGNFFARFVRD